MRTKFKINSNSKFKKQSGQSLVEYLVIVALVAVGGIGIMRVVGQSINVSFARVAKSLGANVEGKLESADVRSSNYSKKTLRNFMSGAESKGSKDTSDDSAEGGS